MCLLWIKIIVQIQNHSYTRKSKMIVCSLKIQDRVDEIYKLFLSEKLESDRAYCKIKKIKKENKEYSLVFNVRAKDPVSMRSFLNTILKIIETYEKTRAIIK